MIDAFGNAVTFLYCIYAVAWIGYTYRAQRERTRLRKLDQEADRNRITNKLLMRRGTVDRNVGNGA